MDKPVGFSSFQVVRMLQKKYRKIGHAGTLDPFASGLLIVLTDRDTKRFQSFEICEKEYSGEILIGVSTDTYDISGSIAMQERTGKKPTCAMIESAARGFIGAIEQVPPRFSALKHGGQRLYELSRKGIPVSPARRTVNIKSFSIDGYDYPIVTFTTVVGKGAYIRSLAHDLGQRLGTGATLLSLRRLRIGEYSVAQARAFGTLLCSTGHATS
ncbi:tRNA pseudouridine(55) synthase TruB [candidate division WOR-3 bacterium]|nr:tRNA pseudouridine(55) synthase TruB [candidate division WOR-3 bacterium]